MTGSFLIEVIFNIDGIGLLGYESIIERDYPVVMGLSPSMQPCCWWAILSRIFVLPWSILE